MREIVHLQAGQCGNQIGAKVGWRRGGRLTVYIQRIIYFHLERVCLSV